MGAKEDLIKKLHDLENAKNLKLRLLSEQNELFDSQLPQLYRMLEKAVDGVPGVTVQRQEMSSTMASQFPSLVIKFIGNTIQFDPHIENKEYGIRARQLRKHDLFFLPLNDGSWKAEFMPNEHYTLNEDFLIGCLSDLVDQDHINTVHLWD